MIITHYEISSMNTEILQDFPHNYIILINSSVFNFCLPVSQRDKNEGMLYLIVCKIQYINL